MNLYKLFYFTLLGTYIRCNSFTVNSNPTRHYKNKCQKTIMKQSKNDNNIFKTILASTVLGIYINTIPAGIADDYQMSNVNLQWRYSEFINQDYFPYKPLKKSLNNSSFSTKTDSIKIINSFYLMPVGLIKSYDYKPKAYEKLIKKFNHIANFKPYQYEGMHSRTRKYFSKNIFQIKVYKY